MKLLILLGIIAVTLGVSAAQSCTAYEGSACSSVFSSANLTATSQSQIDATIDTYFTALSVANISQDCLNYLRFTQCLSVSTPCSGTAWCGSMSDTELTEALNSACGCSGSSCTVGGRSVATIRNYYQGSSSTGRVNNGALYCQDVTVGSAAGTMKMSVMGAALVSIFLSIGLLL